ncbi:MAG: flagellar motor switch protein FliG [Candidatus Latescibacterota bacterium]|jgi:flagellar motor switch protein FliG
MAAETTGRLVCALSASAVAPDTAPASWTPPALTPSVSPFPPLPMRLDAKAKVRKQAVQEETARYVPESSMVLIHAGEFVMGDDEGARDEQPQRKVILNAYWMDKFPVTNLDYKSFVDATGHRKPPHWTSGTYALDQANHPVTHVNLADAEAYANWAGKRLPTEAEWEKAARGTLGQTYPWGDAFRKDNVNSSNDYGRMTPVDQFSGGASPYGVLDMVGNVMERCSDWYYDDYYKTASVDNPTGPEGGQYRVVRGGFYGENKSGVRCAARHYAPPETMQDHIGFRCVKTPLRPGEPVPKPVESTIQPEPPKPVQRPELSDGMSLEQIADTYPEHMAKVVRGMLQNTAEKDEPRNDDCRGVGVLMIGLGQTLGAVVLKFLNDREVEKIAQTITELDRVTQHEKSEVFGTVKKRVLEGDYVLSGGAEFAKGTLEKALGPRKTKVILDRLNSTTSSGFYLLRNVDPNQIVPFISKEHPQTMALILSQLDPTQSAGVINGLPEEMQSDVAYRIARMDNISPQVLRELEEGLARDLQTILSGQITEIGGPKAVAEILNRTGRSTEKNVLERIDGQDAELGEKIRNQMFVYDDIANLTDREIQLILKEIDPRDLAVGLKGACEELQKRVFDNVSEEDAQKIKEEMKFSGPVRMSDVEAVQLRTVQTVRQLEEAGQITIVRGDSNDKFV